MSVQVLTFGGIIQDINVPDRYGHVTDVTLGFKTLQDYVTEDSPPVTANGGPYFGETIGRYGNRIAKGTFTLNQPGVGPVNVHRAHQQRGEQPARRPRRLRRPHLGQPAGLRPRHRRRAAHADQPQR